MKKVLIINLRRFGDIYTTAHLISSILEDSPATQIDMLVYDEFKAAARMLNNTIKIHTLDRKGIITLANNNLFSDAFAIEKLYESMEEIASNRYDHVINYSNDMVSSYLSSYLCSKCQATDFTGIRYSKNNTVETSNDWSIIFNDLLTTYPHTPIHFADCYHRMIDLQYSHTGGKNKIKSFEMHNKTAFQNINKIRENESKGPSPVKIVGIQLRSSSEDKDIPFDCLIDVIGMLLDDPEFYPVLLIAPFAEERNYSNAINKRFNNTLVTIEADLLAISSVLQNLDLVVTPDTVIKHLADLTETPLVEVSHGAAPFLKQGSYINDNIILTPKISTRSWKTNKQPASQLTVTASDIISAIKCLVRPELDKITTFSSQTSMYRVKRDAFGVKYELSGGAVDSKAEIARSISRKYLASLFEQDQQSSISSSDISILSRKEVNSWIAEEKQAILDTTKSLMATIRSLVRIKNNPKLGQEFVISLDKLINHCEKQHLVAIPITLFRSKIEALSLSSFGENIKTVKNHLYDLKRNIQKATHCLQNLEDEIIQLNKCSLINKSQRAGMQL